LELEHLRALIGVADRGSYTAASKALGTSRMTLRARVEALETELGAPLLVSSHRGVTPTETGRWLLERAQRLVSEADELARQARERHGEMSGELRILVPVGMPPDLLGGFSRLLREQHPELTQRIDFSTGPGDTGRRDPDLICHLGELHSGGQYITTLLARTPLRLLASRAYLRQYGRPASLEELGAHALMAWDAPSLDPGTLPLIGGGALPVAPWLVSRDAHLLRAMVNQGAGMALLPQSPTTRGVPGEDLEEVLPDQVRGNMMFRALIPEARAHSPKCRAVLELMRWMEAHQPHLQAE